MSLSTVFFVILAVLCWGTGAFLDKLTLKYLNPVNAFAARALFTVLVFLPLAFAFFSPVKKALDSAGKAAVLLVFSSVVITMSGVYFYLKAMSASEASRIVPMSSTYPMVTFLLALVFLGESATVSKILGIALISGGVFFLSR